MYSFGKSKIVGYISTFPTFQPFKTLYKSLRHFPNSHHKQKREQKEGGSFFIALNDGGQ